MKFLNQFLKFDFLEFSKGKQFLIADIKEHHLFVGGNDMGVDGVTITVLIVKDSYDYGKDGVDNQYQSFNVRIPNVDLENVKKIFSKSMEIKILEFSKASIYGEYRNQLSVVVPNLLALEKINTNINNDKGEK